MRCTPGGFFYSCPAIFEVPLHLIIDRTSDSCADRNRFNRQFSLNDPLTRFVRESQRHYSKLALLTSDDLLLVRLLKASYYSVVFSPCFLVNGVYRSASCGASCVLFGTPRPLDTIT